MNKTNKETSTKNPQVKKQKEYTKPLLTKYGSISSLVQMMGGTGTDGGPLPPVTIT